MLACFKKCTRVKIILKNLIQKKNKIRLLATRCLQVVHLMQQKTNLICKHLREHAMKIIDYEEKKNDTTN